MDFVNNEQWVFAKTVPEWPHFYLVDEKANNKIGFNEAKLFISENGYDGKFYNINVNYYDVGGWTYWASPIAKHFDSQNMLNKCSSEFTYGSRLKEGRMPKNGFSETRISLKEILDDKEFVGLIEAAKKREFNLFDVLDVASYEIRHSNVIAWLLDGKGSHGLGSYFFEKFCDQCRVSGGKRIPVLTASNYKVHREWSTGNGRIDILIESDTWVIVIENKLYSSETGDQLKRYKKYIDDEYGKGRDIWFIYLTVEGKSPLREPDAQSWVSVSYDAVNTLIKDLIGKKLQPNVRSFLEQYAECIKNHFFPDSITIDTKRKIYQKYKEVFVPLEYLFNEKYIQEQCSPDEREMLESILATGKDVSGMLFAHTASMMKEYGYGRHSGLGTWISIVPESLEGNAYLKKYTPFPFVLVFRAKPDAYQVEMWIYKKNRLYNKFSQAYLKSYEDGEPSEEHLLSVIYKKEIIKSNDIRELPLDILKKKIDDYFKNELQNYLDRCSKEILSIIQKIEK